MVDETMRHWGGGTLSKLWPNIDVDGPLASAGRWRRHESYFRGDLKLKQDTNS